MFKLESSRLKREFKIANDTFFASQIYNKYSDMNFVPDGNGTEFTVHFTDDTEFSSKGLPVVESGEENGKLRFVFAENMGVTVTLEFWVHEDGKTICKQVTVTQVDDEKTIDFVLLENMGIVNSQSFVTVHRCEGTQIPHEWAGLGQPFYVDSLYFGCEFPGADSRIVYGTGRIKYYIGKNVGKNYACPVTFMGAAKNNTVGDLRAAFFEFIDFISVKSPLHYTFNTWFDNMGKKVTEESTAKLFEDIHAKLSGSGIALDEYVIDDGWCNYKRGFWSYSKKFPNGFTALAEQVQSYGASLGMWLSPRGGYTMNRKLGKRIEKDGRGFFNEAADEICCASYKYTENMADFMIEQTAKNGITCFKLDGFSLKPCNDDSHDHLNGGKYDMYYASDMWQKWVNVFRRYRASGDKAASAWINLTCYVNPSPFWLQWVNSIWIQNSDDIGFAENMENQSRLDSEITYRDARYYDAFVKRNYQLPLYAVYNHEPIYAKGADVEYTDAEFEKYCYWCACRGAALNEMYLSPELLSDEKCAILAKAIQFQKMHFDILKNAQFIGGNPEENNVYLFSSWNEKGEGIVALRNPTDEETPITLTLNKLLGVPEDFADAVRTDILFDGLTPDTAQYSYDDKLDLTLQPFEMVILKFAK